MVGDDVIRPVGHTVRALFTGSGARRLSETGAAARAWYVSMGDRERAHTTGVWLRPGRGAASAPVLVVGLDSSLLALELGTNKELYLSRLTWAGLRISDIRFQVSPRRAPDGREREDARERPADPPELTVAERERVEQATSSLPEGLKESVSRAMCASLRRNKAKQS